MSRVALALALLTSGCSGLLVGPNPTNQPGVVFDLVWETFDRHYVFFPFKQLSWDSLYDEYHPRALAAASDEELAVVVGELIAELKDLHAGLSTGARIYTYLGYDARPHDFTPAVVFQRYVPLSTTSASAALRYGRFQDAPEIGYLWLAAFQQARVADEFDAALAALGDIQGLVIDVRDNGGGTSDVSDPIAGRFADSARLFSWSSYRIGPRHDDLSQPAAIRLTPRGPRFVGPVALITNRHTVSAAERFVLAMRVLPNVTVVGDTTAGASGIPAIRELPNGWTYRVPQALEYTLERETYEVIGLAPDIEVRRTAADSAAGVDPALERALQVVRGG